MKFLVVLALFAFVAVASAGLYAGPGLVASPLTTSWGGAVIGSPLGLTRTIGGPGLIGPGLIGSGLVGPGLVSPGLLGTQILI